MPCNCRALSFSLEKFVKGKLWTDMITFVAIAREAMARRMAKFFLRAHAHIFYFPFKEHGVSDHFSAESSKRPRADKSAAICQFQLFLDTGCKLRLHALCTTTFCYCAYGLRFLVTEVLPASKSSKGFVAKA